MTHFYAITPIRPSCGFRRSITADQIRERLEGWRTDLAAQRIAVVVNGRDQIARVAEIDKYLGAVDDEVIALAFDNDPETLEMAALSNQLMSLLRAVQRTGVSVALPTLPVSPWTDRAIYSIRRSRRRTMIAKIVLLFLTGCVVFTPKIDIRGGFFTQVALASPVIELQPCQPFSRAAAAC